MNSRTLSILFIGALFACNNNSSGGGGKGAAALKKGSGGQCPQVTGKFDCSTEPEKLPDGSSRPRSTKIEFALVIKERKQVLIIDQENEFIADGEIHTIDTGSEKAEYVIDCSPNTLTETGSTSKGSSSEKLAIEPNGTLTWFSSNESNIKYMCTMKGGGSLTYTQPTPPAAPTAAPAPAARTAATPATAAPSSPTALSSAPTAVPPTYQGGGGSMPSGMPSMPEMPQMPSFPDMSQMPSMPK